MNDLASSRPPSGRPTAADLLQGTLIDSRQRWRDLVNLIADFAFETDEWGRFVLVSPDPALAWPANSLIGQPSTTLLPDDEDGGLFNPFRVTVPVRRRQAWLKRGDGGAVCLTFSVAPILDSLGRIVGVRGAGMDMTENDRQTAQITAALRRAEVLDHILWRMGQEVMAPRMMSAALDALANALGARGAAVLLIDKDTAVPCLAHATGEGATGEGATGEGVEMVRDIATRALLSHDPLPVCVVTEEGRPVLVFYDVVGL